MLSGPRTVEYHSTINGRNGVEPEDVTGMHAAHDQPLESSVVFARPAVAVDGVTDMISTLLSFCLNPMLMSALAVGLVATGYDAPQTEVWAVMGLSMMFMFVMPLFYLLALHRTGRVESLSVREQMDRRWPMIISIVLMIILFPSLLAVAQTTSAAVLSVAGIYLINTVLLLMITVRLRISLHAAGLASFIAVSAIFGAMSSFDGFPGGAVLFALAVVALPLLSWARIRRHEHETGEVLLGILFGLVVPTLELAFLVMTGML